MKIALTSHNKHKIYITKKYFPKDDIICVKLKHNPNPEQPCGDIKYDKHLTMTAALQCALNRIKYADIDFSDYDCIIAIENGLIREDELFLDICEIAIYKPKENEYITSNFFTQHIKCPIPMYYWVKLAKNYEAVHLGYNKTVGELMAADNEKITKDDWMSSIGIPRTKQMEKTMNYIMSIDKFKYNILKIKDYPCKDHTYYDLLTYVSNDNLIAHKLSQIYRNVTLIVSIGMSGCILGQNMSTIMRIPFVPIRKSGTLPPPTKTFKINNIELEVRNIIKDSDNVCIVDTYINDYDKLKCCIKLINSFGASIAGCVTLMENKKHKEKSLDINYKVLIKDV